MTDGDPNPQFVKNFVTSFRVFLIIIAVMVIGSSILLLIIPISIDTSTIFHNCSIEGKATILNITPIICYNCSIEGNTTVPNAIPPHFQNCSITGNITIQNATPLNIHNCSKEENTTFIIGKINHFFSSSSISVIYQSYFTNGGLLNLIINNFAIFLTLIGAFSLYCYFYFNITFNANVISEYPESQQQNLKIFLQSLFLTLPLFGFYVISIILYHSPIKSDEWVLLIVFFCVASLSSGIFNDYVKKIRPKYNNIVQFAAIRDSIKIFDPLIYVISIFCFIFTFIVILYGVISNFNFFSIFFIICFVLLTIWQINIINNEPRSIFDIKIKNSEKTFQGFLLTRTDRDVIHIFDNDEKMKDKTIQIPRTSIEYIIPNRKIEKSEIVNPRQGIFERMVLIWNSITLLKRFLITLLGITIGFVIGNILFLGVAILIIDFGFPPQILIVILSLFVFILGLIIGHSYQKSSVEKKDDECESPP